MNTEVFTGIIEAIGTIKQTQRLGGDVRLRIHTGALNLSDVKLGDSIAINGVCLTVIKLANDGFWADVSRETLALSLLGNLPVGTTVNLEKALMPTSRMGGHMVSGHIDGVGKIVRKSKDARSIRFTIKAPAELKKYIAHKGSVCVDGASLTVNAVNDDCFELNIVPHTVQETTLSQWRVGEKVHLEVDVIARYLERLLNGEVVNAQVDMAADGNKQNGTHIQGITLASLATSGIIKPA